MSKRRQKLRALVEAFDRAAIPTPCDRCGALNVPVWSDMRYTPDGKFYAVSTQPCPGCKSLVVQVMGSPGVVKAITPYLDALGPHTVSESGAPTLAQRELAHVDISSAVRDVLGRRSGLA